MAWSGGAFTRIGGATHWVDDKNAAINIVASRHDTNDEDLATGINFCLNRDGTSRPTADFLPAVDNTQGLGSASFRWATITTPIFKATATQINAFGPTAAGFIDITPDINTFTCTLTGCTTSPTGTATWFRVGKIVLLVLPSLSGTSNATTLTFTGLPAVIQPATLNHAMSIALASDNGAIVTANALISAGSGTIQFAKNGALGGWTAAGSKGVNTAVLAYTLI